MKAMVCLFSLFLLATTSSAFSEIPYIPARVADSLLAAGNTQFAFDLFSAVCAEQDGDNVFLSPYSISMALGMTWNGASGETAHEMATVLGFNMPVTLLNHAFQRINEQLTAGDPAGTTDGEPFTLTVANGIWVKEGFELLNSYVSAITEYYSAGVENLDFAGDPEGSREVINTWVAGNTMDRILDLIPPGLLGAETRAVLTNAVYFKASWEHAFEEALTYDDRFQMASGDVVQVPFMHRTEFYDYGVFGSGQAISLDYSGGTASMVIILPVDMDSFLPDFTPSVLSDIMGRMTRNNIALSMPKFEFTRSVSLSAVLASMGMETAFGADANFSAMTGGPDLYISEVLHKAFVLVDESGTEAAAATAVVMNITSASPVMPLEVRINRPFIFLIRDSETGSVVFMGRVMDPRG